MVNTPTEELTDDRVTITANGESTTVTGAQLGQYVASLAGGRVRVPTEQEIGDNAFLEAPDLELLADELIERHTTLGHLRALTVHFRWKAKGGKSKGAAVYGKCTKPSGLLADYSGADFIIWLAADYVRDARFTQRQIEALLFHELLHTHTDSETGEPITLAHDFEGFRKEVEEYGWWSQPLLELRNTSMQLKLWPADSELDQNRDHELDDGQ